MDPSAQTMPETLIIAHRGASGYRPEHTASAYELAAQMGADYLEPDLVMTRDGVLVDRHEPRLDETTDIADHPEFASRRTTKVLDGRPTSGWFTEDFTVAELKTLRAKERLPGLRPGSAGHNGREEILTFEETLQLRERLSNQHQRTIGIIPEIKHSSFLRGQGLSPEAELVRLVEQYGLNHAEAPMWTQSFELATLQDLRENHGYLAKLTFLTEAEGGPFDLADSGTSYAELVTAPALRELARWIDGISPGKEQIMPSANDGSMGPASTLVRDAHEVGLKVTPWTFRGENVFLPSDYRLGEDPGTVGRVVEEVWAFLKAGVDGIFCDHPDLAVAARERFLAEQ